MVGEKTVVANQQQIRRNHLPRAKNNLSTKQQNKRLLILKIRSQVHQGESVRLDQREKVRLVPTQKGSCSSRRNQTNQVEIQLIDLVQAPESSSSKRVGKTNRTTRIRGHLIMAHARTRNRRTRIARKDPQIGNIPITTAVEGETIQTKRASRPQTPTITIKAGQESLASIKLRPERDQPRHDEGTLNECCNLLIYISEL
mmetsp:Transcript_10725/g.16366  ORF Transcript_10725/g.16366 Transcript_10725/m.16366 type:complete len:200 (+) Transcript_10725:1265-1864(+)